MEKAPTLYRNFYSFLFLFYRCHCEERRDAAIKPKAHYILMQLSPFLMCLDFGVCAPQSASFALATTHSPNVSLNASRPYSVPPLRNA